MQKVHRGPREHTHKETLIQPPGDLQTDEQEDHERVKVLLGGDRCCAALHLNVQAVQEGETRFNIRNVGQVL